MPESSIRVLLAEDNQGLLDTLADVLCSAGMEVGKALDAHEASGLLAKTHYDVAVIDMVLPGPSGVEVIRKLKESSPSTRVVICTAYYDSQLLLEARSLGVDQTVLKPADPVALIALIRNLAGSVQDSG
jgi:DNA-binding NarL/FixJ family response regulator